MITYKLKTKSSYSNYENYFLTCEVSSNFLNFVCIENEINFFYYIHGENMIQPRINNQFIEDRMVKINAKKNCLEKTILFLYY